MSKINDKDDLVDAMASLSKVSKKGSKHKDKLMFAGLCMVCLLIFGVMMWPEKEKSVDVIDSGSKNAYFDNTLQENLTAAQNLRDEAENKRIEAIKDAQKQSLMLPAVAHRLPIEEDESLPPPKKEVPKEILMRMNASSTFFTNDDDKAIQQTQSKDASGVTEATILSKGGDGDFLNSKGAFSAVSATKIAHPNHTVPAGEMIPATLETAISSTIPGFVKAITTRDIYSLTGNQKLIPRGSTIIGQFNSGVVQGQTRIAVIWNRLQLPNGIVVALNSPGTDSIGRSGQGADFVDHHFFERFGSSVMLSLLGYYASNNGVSSFDQMNSKAMFKNQIANSLQAASSAELEQNMNIKPTIAINQGTNINIFVAQDLSFYQVMRGAS